MKTYPKIDWKPIDKYSRKRMDRYEDIIQQYLDSDESEKWNNYPNYLAYNLAFLLLHE